MSYKMFIDDERFPIGPDWVICRDTQDVVDSITTLGFPSYISFDHDLGDCEETGYDLAKEFIDLDLDHGIIPPDFKFMYTLRIQLVKRILKHCLQTT